MKRKLKLKRRLHFDAILIRLKKGEEKKNEQKTNWNPRRMTDNSAEHTRTTKAIRTTKRMIRNIPRHQTEQNWTQQQNNTSLWTGQSERAERSGVELRTELTLISKWANECMNEHKFPCCCVVFVVISLCFATANDCELRQRGGPLSVLPLLRSENKPIHMYVCIYHSLCHGTRRMVWWHMWHGMVR